MNWLALRTEFPVCRKWAFLDHAGVSAGSARAAGVMEEFVRDMTNSGVTKVGFWADRCETVRRRLAEMLNADIRGLAFVPNTTAAIGIVAEGFPWEPGDNVVFPADEYPSNQYPWMNLARRGVEARRVPPRGNRVELADLHDAMDGRTRLCAVSWVGYASGFRMDLPALAEMCRSRNVRLLVDVIQGFGALPLDVADLDFVACGSHKWSLGFQGAGFLYVRPELLELLNPRMVGAHSVVDPFNYGRINYRLKPDATRWEGGTLNFGGIAAWGASLRVLHQLGADAVRDRIRHITDHLCANAGSARLAVFSDRDEAGWSGIVSLAAPGRDAAALMKRAKKDGVAVNCRSGRLRVAPHCYTSEEDIDRFLDSVSGV